MMVYDIEKGDSFYLTFFTIILINRLHISDVWENVIQLPQNLFSIKCCDYKGNLFLISGNFNIRFGYFYNQPTKDWQRIEIEDPDNVCPKNMGDFILYSIGDYLFIKGKY